MILVLLVAWAVDVLLGYGVAGLLIALVVVVIGTFGAYWKSDAVALAMSHARALVKQARFWPSPYVGKHGWVSMDVTLRKNWDEVAALIRESYELVAPKAALAKLR